MIYTTSLSLGLLNQLEAQTTLLLCHKNPTTSAHILLPSRELPFLHQRKVPTNLNQELPFGYFRFLHLSIFLYCDLLITKLFATWQGLYPMQHVRDVSLTGKETKKIITIMRRAFPQNCPLHWNGKSCQYRNTTLMGSSLLGSWYMSERWKVNSWYIFSRENFLAFLAPLHNYALKNFEGNAKSL